MTLSLVVADVTIFLDRQRLGNPSLPKKKGLQLALEPLNGRGIAGFVPEP